MTEKALNNKGIYHSMKVHIKHFPIEPMKIRITTCVEFLPKMFNVNQMPPRPRALYRIITTLASSKNVKVLINDKGGRIVLETKGKGSHFKDGRARY